MFTTKAIAGKKGSLKSLKTHNILNINFTNQAPVVKNVYNTIHWINLYLVDDAIGWSQYLSTGQRFIQWRALSSF